MYMRISNVCCMRRGRSGPVGPTGPTQFFEGERGAVAVFDGNGSIRQTKLSGPVIIDTNNNYIGGHDITINGNLNLSNTTATGIGFITKGTLPFIHDFPGNNGNPNIFVGIQAGGNLSATSGQNIGIGSSSIKSITSGIRNIGVGGQTLTNATTSSANIAIGTDALASNINTNQNIAIGDSALFNNIGSKNIALGNGSLLNNTTGKNNVAIGYASLLNNIAGDNNIVLGTMVASGYAGNESNNIIIGNSGVVNDNNQIRIGEAQTGCFIQGIHLQTIAPTGVPVYVDSTGKLGTVLSSVRYKENIQDMDNISSKILDLRPVTFNYKPEIDQSGICQYGLIAEEVEKIMKDLVIYKNEQPETVAYHTLNVLLLNEVKKLTNKNKEYDMMINKMAQKIMEFDIILNDLKLKC
ncbi:MAG: hypothetical protein Edafosvirus1_73 [Edafosvirus sp.]|uniref:Peptidase S74 domain-containing protein n=1 Tax=Edafosvirus sp. TaxID=2487765 RepID=A0A3G4ZS48_9VIRU|nr:MAG: hypothetical protein Edafosvirus1_73 [Edafosvirus sp.]